MGDTIVAVAEEPWLIGSIVRTEPLRWRRRLRNRYHMNVLGDFPKASRFFDSLEVHQT